MRHHCDSLLFKGESKHQKYSSLFRQILAIAIAVYCCFQLNENPPAIIIISLPLFIVFMLSGHGIVLVYEGAIEFRVQNSLLPFFTKKRRFGFDEIVSVNANLQFGRKEQYTADLTHSAVISMSTRNTIKFKLIDGKEKTIITRVYKADILKAFETVNHLSNIKIQFT